MMCLRLLFVIRSLSWLETTLSLAECNKYFHNGLGSKAGRGKNRVGVV